MNLSSANIGDQIWVRASDGESGYRTCVGWILSIVGNPVDGRIMAGYFDAANYLAGVAEVLYEAETPVANTWVEKDA